jgi:hypothetical protein
MDNNAIIIKTQKTYNQTFIPKEQWSYWMEIIDKTNAFYAKSIIFQKKK